MRTTAGDELSILFQGHYNIHQGPDFTGGRVRIGKDVWAGNIELHVRTSDWNRHLHSSDINYENVILHVVWCDDEQYVVSRRLPTFELQDRVPKVLLNNYHTLMGGQSFIPCDASVSLIDELKWVCWKERLFVERLQRKCMEIQGMLASSNNHWEQVLWWMLARSFGLHVNTDAFYETARSIPYNVLLKHSHQIHQVEALLFGQCGLLRSDFIGQYPRMLLKEYEFLVRKYNFTPAHVRLKFLRMRPASFPTVRLAQLAVVAHTTEKLFSKLIGGSSLAEVQASVDVTANDYWHYHFVFDEETPFQPKRVGADMVNNIVMNAFIPVMYSYGYQHREEHHQKKAIEWAKQLRAENNSVVMNFKRLGVKVTNGSESQAVLELKSQYCNQRRCLDCAIGNALLKRTSKE